MKLSHDCIRNILLLSEELPPFTSIGGERLFKSNRLKKYSEDEINYAISKLGNDDAQLVSGYVKVVNGKPYMTSLGNPTFEGHKYLDNIRDPKVWAETKKISSKLTSVSIEIMSSIASEVISKMLNLN